MHTRAQPPPRPRHKLCTSCNTTDSRSRDSQCHICAVSDPQGEPANQHTATRARTHCDCTTKIPSTSVCAPPSLWSEYSTHTTQDCRRTSATHNILVQVLREKALRGLSPAQQARGLHGVPHAAVIHQRGPTLLDLAGDVAVCTAFPRSVMFHNDGAANHGEHAQSCRARPQASSRRRTCRRRNVIEPRMHSRPTHDRALKREGGLCLCAPLTQTTRTH